MQVEANSQFFGTASEAARHHLPRSFSGGLAPVQVSRKWGYIDKANQVVIEPVFDGAVAGPFKVGVARVAVGERWGYINRSADFLIPPQFEMAYDFHEGRATVIIDGQSGFIDETGRIVIAAQYKFASEFSNGWRLFRFLETHAAEAPARRVSLTVTAILNFRRYLERRSDFGQGFALLRRRMKSAI
jgi:hypothetical protein